MHMLDTNACLDFLLARQPGIVPRIERAFGRIMVSAITAAELRVGNRKSLEPERDAQRIDVFLNGVQVAAFDDAAAQAYGAAIRKIGMKRIGFDRLIAAHALALNVTLVTNNEDNFADIPGLRIENWTR